VGAAAMATHTLKVLLLSETPLRITVFEASEQAGCGMPYRAGTNADYMYCNAFSKEIPSITQPLVAWLHDQDDVFLERWDLERSDIDARVFYPRVMLGEYLQSEFDRLGELGRSGGHTIDVVTASKIVDVTPAGDHIVVSALTHNGEEQSPFTQVVLVTGHSWPSNPRIGSADLVSLAVHERHRSRTGANRSARFVAVRDRRHRRARAPRRGTSPWPDSAHQTARHAHRSGAVS